ncbi:hypothetical protein DPMN_078312 [Dreissena polymorpha]|uniref:Uncharacterized protein n=1 Tax=Dreissena polymorpha TaxID=45954 RepID=A0A9D3YQW0_DREPO|nr:hypothetical protein DPMN_078312 [Dreissena polymorpha]
MDLQLEDVCRRTVKACVNWKPSCRRRSSHPGPQPSSVHEMPEPCARPGRQHKWPHR